MNANTLWNERELADVLGVSVRTLQAWRSEGRGPRFIKLSPTLVRYSPDDVREFVRAKTRTHTNDPGPADRP